ncbi:PP0621 family protein [Aquabacterium sp.]|uniref:PP0621 family protein n=1 Tax=Aquabacterium sp. TaxID=1872578 RepID=UPI0035B0DE18
MKLMLMLLALGAVLWLWRGTRAAPSAQVPPQAPRPDGSSSTRGAPANGLPVPMVECAFCDLHVPRAEAIESPNRRQHYCCEAHRIEHLRQGRSTATPGPR